MKNYLPYIAAVLGLFVFYLFGRKSRGGAIAPASCSGTLSYQRISTIAEQLKSHFSGFNWPEESVIALWREMGNACDVENLYRAFGVWKSPFFSWCAGASGDLDYFMSKFDSKTREACRKFGFGKTNF